MKRTRLNFIIDAFGFAGFSFLITTGFLVRYVLPPGSGYGTTLWGLDRHEWGGVHFWIAILFLSVMVLHLFLHWRWIVGFLKGRAQEASGGRISLGLLVLLAVLTISLAPFGSPVEKTRLTTAHRRESVAETQGTESIRGRMTLREIEEATGIPEEDLRSRLGMPLSASLVVGVGKLGKSYDFDVDDVRKIVSDLQSKE